MADRMLPEYSAEGAAWCVEAMRLLVGVNQVWKDLGVALDVYQCLRDPDRLVQDVERIRSVMLGLGGGHRAAG